MRILMAQRFDIANVGCAERIWRQAEQLQQQGHSITLVNFPHPERRRLYPRLRSDAPEGVKVLDLDRKAVSIRANYYRITQAMSEVDLVHLWKPYPDILLPALFALGKYPKPLHYDWDDLEGGPDGVAARLTGSRMAGRLLAFWEREILNWCDTITCASEEICRLCTKAGFPPGHLFPGPVGATIPALPEPLLRQWKHRLEGRIPLALLGQLETDDFPGMILDCLPKVIAQIPHVLLVVVGDGQARKKLECAASNQGLASHVLFTGYVPREEAHTILSKSSLLLFPLNDDLLSRCKSPLVVIEAMAHGIPVVASRVGEAPRMLGDAGCYVETLNADDWAGVILEALGSGSGLDSRGNELRQRYLDNWTWKHSVNSLIQAYECAMNCPL